MSVRLLLLRKMRKKNRPESPFCMLFKNGLALSKGRPTRITLGLTVDKK
ncbi:MAG: hypothetical protein KKH94_13170 [Candidatus Omnitrophica bacterium]|nr:hypothetical protein [Candidatus Omnitrophota bacterium]